MFALYFEHSDGRIEWVNGCNDEKDVTKGINDTIARFNRGKKRPFEHYYTRVWTKGSLTYYDVGSHTEFFIVEKEG